MLENFIPIHLPRKHELVCRYLIVYVYVRVCTPKWKVWQIDMEVWLHKKDTHITSFL